MLTINYLKKKYNFHNGPNDFEVHTYSLAIFKNKVNYKNNCFLKPSGATNFYN